MFDEAFNAYVKAVKNDAQGMYAPRLIANDAGETFENLLKSELQQCDGFDISVAFITNGTIASLKQDFFDFSDRMKVSHDSGVQCPAGRIITSTKSYFNDPKMFKELRLLQRDHGIDVRIWDGADHSHRIDKSHVCPDGNTPIESQNFHPKGYVFLHHAENGEPLRTIYVGSSNMTENALRTQREWNLRVSSTPEGSIAAEVDDEIKRQIKESVPLTDEWIEEYEKEFKSHNTRQQLAKAIEETQKDKPIIPNSMQRTALARLQELRDKGETRAIVVAATGTGKTILSALDVRALRPRRVLYLVHQEQILRSAIDSYRRVLRDEPEENFGLIAGTVADDQSNRKFVFSTIQSMQIDNRLHSFAPDEFDYILVDEVHHAAAASYKKIIDYFHPRFLLGMTATPERTDGENIFDLFGNNVAYEIRLQDALNAELLVPFHFYGVTEYLTLDDTTITVEGGRNSQEITYLLRDLVSEGRVRYIIDNLQKYQEAGVPTKGLVFCSRVDEAQQLSKKFNECIDEQAERPYRTVEVDGSTPKNQVREAITELSRGDLDYIFTVDLFNEGIDIPAINQIVMLRNTESSIIFTQQLGRGLRKSPGKDYVTIIDFVGNYAKSYLITMALSGHNGVTRTGNTVHPDAPQASSISFDRISAQRIAETIKHADLSEMKRLTEFYTALRNKLHRVPTLLDIFDADASMAPLFSAKSKCYYSFVQSRERSLRTKHPVKGSECPDLSRKELGILRLLADHAVIGLRPHELLALAALGNVDLNYVSANLNQINLSALSGRNGLISAEQLATCARANFPSYGESFSTGYGDEPGNPRIARSALRMLDGDYYLKGTRTHYDDAFPLSATEQGWSLSREMTDALHNPFFKSAFDDSVRTGLALFTNEFDGALRQELTVNNGFVVGWQYSLSEIMGLLNVEKEAVPLNIGGYVTDTKTNSMPIFIKYAASQYEDRFLNAQDIYYFSKDRRTLTSPEFLWADDDSHPHFIPVFVRRKDREEARSGKEPRNKNYYYVGSAVGFLDKTETTHPSSSDPDQQIRVVVSRLHLRKPVPMRLLQDLTGEIFL